MAVLAQMTYAERVRAYRSGAASRKRKAGKRAACGRHRDELMAMIKARPGARPSELAKSISIRPTQIHALIAKARAEKLIVKCGQGYSLNS